MIYLISDLKEKTNLSRETLNYYYNEGLFREVRRAKNSNYRIFNEKTIKIIKKIIKLRQKGFSIKEIKEILNNNEKNVS